MNIQHKHADWAWANFDSQVVEIASRPEVRSICELGAGANPTFPLEFIREHNLEYSILDISESELKKAPDGYHKINADIASPDFVSAEKFDFVFSRMLAEHVTDGRAFHSNCNKILAKNGIAFHWFPTLFNVPMFANYLMPDNLSAGILKRTSDVDRSTEGFHGKFPAKYSWCRGPTKKQIRMFEEIGFEVEEYFGFWGHNYYLKIPPLHKLQSMTTRYFLKHPKPMFTIAAWIVLKRRD